MYEVGVTVVRERVVAVVCVFLSPAFVVLRVCWGGSRVWWPGVGVCAGVCRGDCRGDSRVGPRGVKSSGVLEVLLVLLTFFCNSFTFLQVWNLFNLTFICRSSSFIWRP